MDVLQDAVEFLEEAVKKIAIKAACPKGQRMVFGKCLPHAIAKQSEKLHRPGPGKRKAMAARRAAMLK